VQRAAKSLLRSSAYRRFAASFAAGSEAQLHCAASFPPTSSAALQVIFNVEFDER